MLIAILRHTPIWVLGLLLVLVALGVSQSFPRSSTLRRSTILPLLLAGLSLFGVVSNFGTEPQALLAWAGGVGSALAALHGRVDTSAVRFSAATRHFELPGSWWPLAAMLALFALKFGAGVALATHPELRHSAGFALATSAAYGSFSGIFLGRAMALWALARQALLQPA